ncbi:DUF4115 domain-containing protein [Pontibacterium granulatum]|uniref:RodZ domain-containing protein n=1 Tax=Pontibacterium granulatum TaxID=2036029 RepID=UPI00249C56F4|nr:RodZ domain-containing protein [Pontibacterium granulatum]MDI3323672.1 DUF4115 domain-containing protein [Pontibacterium granulatum]
MSSQTQLDQEEVVQEVFPGAEFAAAREARGLRAQDVAHALNFSAAHIEAIEEGRLDALPGRVFALGYLRAYARHIGLDENKAVEDYERLTGGASKAASKPLKTVSSAGTVSAKSKGGALKWLVITSLVAGIAAAGFWWTQQQVGPAEAAPIAQMNLPADDSAPEPMAAEASVVSSESEASNAENAVVVEDSPAEAVQLSLVSASEAVATAEEATVLEGTAFDTAASEVESPVAEGEPAGGQVVTEQVTDDVNVKTPVAAEAAEAGNEETAPVVAGEGHLKVVLNADCWVEVRDGSGRLLVASVRSPSHGVDVRGKAPMKVTLGALSAVDSMTYNNDAVTLEKSGRGNVLRVTLPVVE